VETAGGRCRSLVSRVIRLLLPGRPVTLGGWLRWRCGRERFWMPAASQGAAGSVPHVFASDDALGPVDASWLVLERLPYTHDPGWGGMRSTGCRCFFAGGSHSRSGPCSRTGMLIPPSGRGWPGTCRPPRISTGSGTMLLSQLRLRHVDPHCP
jgi:hypothetical protein